MLTDEAEDMETGERILLSQEEELAQKILISISAADKLIRFEKPDTITDRAFQLSSEFFKQLQKRRVKIVKKIQDR